MMIVLILILMIGAIMPLGHVVCKLGNMRKAQSWIVYPNGAEDDGTIIVQCDNRIAKINKTTGAGVLSVSRTYPGFIFLSKALGATDIQVPMEIVQQFITAQGQPGQHIGGNVYIGGSSCPANPSSSSPSRPLSEAPSSSEPQATASLAVATSS